MPRWRSPHERAKRWTKSQQGRRLPARLNRAQWLQGTFLNLVQLLPPNCLIFNALLMIFQYIFFCVLSLFLLASNFPRLNSYSDITFVLQVDAESRRFSCHHVNGHPAAQLRRRNPLHPALPHQQILQNAPLTEKPGEWFQIGFWSCRDWQEWSISSVLLIFPSVRPSDWGCPRLMALSLNKCQSFPVLCHR